MIDHNDLVKERKENRMLWDEPDHEKINYGSFFSWSDLHMPDYLYPTPKKEKYHVDKACKELEVHFQNISARYSRRIKKLF